MNLLAITDVQREEGGEQTSPARRRRWLRSETFRISRDVCGGETAVTFSVVG